MVVKGRVLSVCVSERSYQTAYREARAGGLSVAAFLARLVRAGLAQFNHDDDPVGACAAWLRELLADGPLPASRVCREARAMSFRERHLRAAREALHITRTKAPGRQRWFWHLPATRPAPQPAVPVESREAASGGCP